MRNRIVSIVLALSMLAAVFVAFPTSADIDFAGSVKTTDNAGAAKDVYVQYQDVYVSCEVLYQGFHSDINIEVRLEYLDGTLANHFHATANVPDDGWYNCTEVGAWTLSTAGVVFDWDQDRVVMYVILEDDASGFEIARATITVLEEGLTLDPSPGMGGYTPGQALTAKLITQWTAYVFYVHTTNTTDVDVALMNWTPVIAPQGYWEKSFTLAADLADGTYHMKVRRSDTHELMYQLDFTVQKYLFNVWTDKEFYLPGEVVRMEVVVLDIATFAPVAGVSVKYWGEWDNFSANGSAVFHTWQNGTIDTAMGVWEFTIPTNVVLYQDLDFMFWANESTTRSVQTWVSIELGQLRGEVDASSADYMPGSTVAVQTRAFLYEPSYPSWMNEDPLPGANVDVVVLYNGTAVADYGKAAMTTADDGTVAYTFTLAADAGKGVYTVKATISKVGQSVVVTDSFDVNWQWMVQVMFEKEYYYTEDSVTANLVLAWNGETVEESVNYIYGTDDEILSSGTTTETSVEFDLPEGYSGGVWIEVSATHNGYNQWAMDWAEVRIADLYLIAERDEYRPGDNLVFRWNIVTNLEDASLEWEIIDWYGVKVAGDTPDFDTSGSFDYEVPEENPSDWFGVTMWMTTADGGFEESYVEVGLVGDDELRVWPGKSKYMTGEFRPGDKVKLSYEVTAVYHDPYPSYVLYIWTDFDPATTSVIVDSNKGTVSFLLPKDTPAGQIAVYVEVYDAATGDFLDDSETSIVVNHQLSGWDRSVAGMSASDFTILVLIIVMILLLIIVPLLKNKGVMGKAEKVEPPPTPPQ